MRWMYGPAGEASDAAEPSVIGNPFLIDAEPVGKTLPLLGYWAGTSSARRRAPGDGHTGLEEGGGLAAEIGMGGDQLGQGHPALEGFADEAPDDGMGGTEGRAAVDQPLGQ